MHIKDMNIGLSRQLSLKFDQNDVANFAQLSNDSNPVHLDPAYAATTIFKKPIVHGMLCASLISAVIANELPGPGSIYKEQSLTFIKPVYLDESITAHVTITEIIAEKSIVILDTIVYKNNDPAEEVIRGRAVIKKIDS